MLVPLESSAEDKPARRGAGFRKPLANKRGRRDPFSQWLALEPAKHCLLLS